MGGVGCWEVRIHLWSTPLSPHSHPLKKNSPPSLRPWAPSTPSPPQPPQPQQQQGVRYGSCIRTQEKSFTHFIFALEVFCSPHSEKVSSRLSGSLVAFLVLNLNTPREVAALVFSLCIFGSVFPLADLCLGAAKIKRAFWCRPGCLCKWRNAAQSSAP